MFVLELLLKLIIQSIFVNHVFCDSSPRIITPINNGDPPNLPKPGNKSVLIIGGDISGLSAALLLAQRGFKVHVTNPTTQLGGSLADSDIKVGNSTFKLPRIHHDFYTNYYQSKNISKMVAPDLFKNTTEELTLTLTYPNSKPTVIDSNYKYLFYYHIYENAACTSFKDWVESMGTLKSITHFNYDTQKERLNDVSFAQHVASLGPKESFIRCLLQPVANATGHSMDTLGALDALVKMQMYLISAHDALRNIQIHMPKAENNSSKTLVSALVNKLKSLNVTFQLNHSVNALSTNDLKGKIDGDWSNPSRVYDFVILSQNISSTRSLLTTTRDGNTGAPLIFNPINNFLSKIRALKNDAPITVAKVWLNKMTQNTKPNKMLVSHTSNVMSVTILDRFHSDLATWARLNKGSVLEIHLANMPAGRRPGQSTWSIIYPQIITILPELKNASLLAINEYNLTSLPSVIPGQALQRPRVDALQKLGISNFILASDWLTTNGYPSDGLEKAVSIGFEAANQVLIASHVRQVRMEVTSSFAGGII